MSNPNNPHSRPGERYRRPPQEKSRLLAVFIAASAAAFFLVTSIADFVYFSNRQYGGWELLARLGEGAAPLSLFISLMALFWLTADDG